MHAAKGVVTEEKSRLEAIIGKYKVSDADVDGTCTNQSIHPSKPSINRSMHPSIDSSLSPLHRHVSEPALILAVLAVVAWLNSCLQQPCLLGVTTTASNQAYYQRTR